MANDNLVNLGLDASEGAREVGHTRRLEGCCCAHRSNTLLIVTRSEAGIEARSKGSSGYWLALSPLLIRSGV
jgi:hypothetical protein